MLDAQKENIQKIYSFCKNYTLNNNNHFPSALKIQGSTQINIPEIKSILQLLVTHKYLKYKNKKYYLPEQKIKRKKQQIPIPVKQEIKKQKFNLDFIFGIILLTVFIAFLYIGIKSLYLGMTTIKSNTDSMIFAIAFTLISAVFFKKMIECFRLKNKMFWFYLFFYLILSVFNTITFNRYFYQLYQDKLFTTENITAIQDKGKNEINDKKIVMIENEIKGIEKEKIRQENILNNLNKDDEKYSFYYWNINGNNGFIKKLEVKNKELNKLYDEKNKLLSNNKVIEITQKKELLSNDLMKVYLFFPAFIIEFFISICLVLLLDNFKKKD
jgi:hypothetical protein